MLNAFYSLNGQCKFTAIRLTHDEIMIERYGRNPDDFQTKYKIIDEEIRNTTKESLQKGKDVILDYGFWAHEQREEYYNWAKTLTDNVIFHNVYCDMNLAKQRVLKRSQTDINALWIDEAIFNLLVKKYEPWSFADNFPVILHNAPNKEYIEKLVPIEIDRPLGSKHPKYGFTYPVNYGYVPFTKSGDNEEIDAYVLMIDKPLKNYMGRCIGIIHRTNDNDDKLIIVPDTNNLTNEQIENDTSFQEKWFKHIIIR